MYYNYNSDIINKFLYMLSYLNLNIYYHFISWFVESSIYHSDIIYHDIYQKSIIHFKVIMHIFAK